MRNGKWVSFLGLRSWGYEQVVFWRPAGHPAAVYHTWLMLCAEW